MPRTLFRRLIGDLGIDNSEAREMVPLGRKWLLSRVLFEEAI